MNDLGIVYAEMSPTAIGRVLLQLGGAYHPRDVVREYVTNSLDARLAGQKEQIDVIFDIRDRRIIVADNGSGMQPGIFSTLPMKVGESILKYGNPEFVGEKGLGLLSFASIGRTMHLITRPNYNAGPNFQYQMWEIDTKRGYRVKPDQLTPEQMDMFFYGRFSHGTKVVIDGVDPDLFKKVFLSTEFKRRLREQYTVALKKEMSEIRIGKFCKRTKTIALSSIGDINYETESSRLLVNETIEVPIKGEERPGKLEVLLFVDPERDSELVSVHSKNVMVYDSVTRVEEFERHPVWGSGRLYGYVNDNFNSLIMGRTGFERQTNAFKAWYQAMSSLESRVAVDVEDSKRKGKKSAENKYVNQVVDVFSRLWGRLGSLYESSKLGRDKDGIDIAVTGIVVPPQQPDGPEREKGKRKRNGNGNKGPGPGTFHQDEDGIVETVAPKKGVRFPRVSLDENFPVYLQNRRFRLEYDLVEPTIFLNPNHIDFQERTSDKDKKVFQRYLIDIISEGIAMYYATNLERENKLVGSPLEVLEKCLEREEEARFLALRESGIV